MAGNTLLPGTWERTRRPRTLRRHSVGVLAPPASGHYPSAGSARVPGHSRMTQTERVISEPRGAQTRPRPGGQGALTPADPAPAAGATGGHSHTQTWLQPPVRCDTPLVHSASVSQRAKQGLEQRCGHRASGHSERLEGDCLHDSHANIPNLASFPRGDVTGLPGGSEGQDSSAVDSGEGLSLAVSVQPTPPCLHPHRGVETTKSQPDWSQPDGGPGADLRDEASCGSRAA